MFFLKFFIPLFAALALTGCTLPRGAALEREIVRGVAEPDSTFEVLLVSGKNVGQLNAWPATGGGGLAGWLPSGGGSDGGLIRSGDVLAVTIFDAQENSLIVPPGTKRVELPALAVSSSGEVFLPYVGAVPVSGQTPDAARTQLEGRLQTIAPSATVLLTRQSGKQNAVDVVTGVNRPGSYPMEGRGKSLLSVIADSGGVQSGLRNPIVRLIRGGRTYEVRAERLLSDGTLNTDLRGGDKIIIQSDERYFTSLGATGTEKLVYFDKTDVTALEAISLVGGVSDGRANLKGVLVLRDYPAKVVRSDGKGPTKPNVVFTFDLTSADGLFAARTFRVNPKDTVMATESPVASVQTVFGILGSVIGLRNAATTN